MLKAVPNTNQPYQRVLDTVSKPVYPTMDSLQAVIDLAKAKLPICSDNDLMSVLMTYHNTLLDQVKSCRSV